MRSLKSHVFISLIATTIWLSLSLSGCSTSNVRSEFTYVVDRDAFRRVSGREAEKVEANVPFKAGDEPVWIESPGFVSVLALPRRLEGGKLEIRMKPLSDWAGKTVREYSNQVVTDLLTEVYLVQLDLGSGKSSLALERVKKLRLKFPEISYLGFLEASCLVAQGEKDEAIAALQSALKTYSTHSEGLKLYRSLAGHEFSSESSKKANIEGGK